LLWIFNHHNLPFLTVFLDMLCHFWVILVQILISYCDMMPKISGIRAALHSHGNQYV
jgi:hypothetical protein